MPSYDEIGATYSRYRRHDARIAHAIRAALGHAKLVVNVGAGTGSYEPPDKRVVAVEPSMVMLAQRSASKPADRVVRARAEELPFVGRRFDAAMAVLTVHHWEDWRKGLSEMRRVARRVAVLTWDPQHDGFWLTRHYFPDLLELDRAIFPSIEGIAGAIGGRAAVEVIRIPRDCSDGFLGAYWARPEAYLDEGA